MTLAHLGQILALCSAISFALANNFISRASRSGGDKGVMFSVLVTMAISTAICLWQGIGGTSSFGGPHFWVGMAWFALAGVFAMFLGRSLLYSSIQRLGVTRSSAVKRLNPFFSVLLAAIILSEPITRLDGLGLFAIAVGFALLIRDSFIRRGDALSRVVAPTSYLFGVAAALSYAIAYIMRKLGLDLVGSPAFGTLISAVAGFGCFAVMAIFSSRARSNVTLIFAYLDRWIVLSAILVSLGQILLFAALAYEKVSTVVMIASLEIFFSVLISKFVFRNEENLSPSLLLAAALAMSGVVMIAM